MRVIKSISYVIAAIFVVLSLFVIAVLVFGTAQVDSYDRAMAAVRRQNYPSAARQFQRLAEQGMHEAQFALGALYMEGAGVPKDYQEATKLFRQAAQQDDRNACFSLGVIYASGMGTDKNPDEATAWFRRAAELGHARSQFVMARNYAAPGSAMRDDVIAARWAFRAAQQGVVEAQVMLAAMYQSGTGVPKDPTSAYAWATITAARAENQEKIRDEAVRLQDISLRSMRPEELIEAQRLALAWKSQPESEPLSPGKAAIEQNGIQASLSFEGDQAVVRWRLVRPSSDPMELTGDINGKPLGILSGEPYPQPGAKTSVVLLLDASDPGRQDGIALDKQKIIGIAKRADVQHEVDVAVYAKDFHLLQPKNSSPELLETMLAQSAPLAEPARLGAALKAAIEMPSLEPAERRGIFVFDDGHSDDAIDAKSLIESARSHHASLNFVVSHSNRSIDPGAIAALADATGGLVVTDDASLRSFQDAPFWPLDSGGTVRVTVNKAPRPFWQADPVVRFVFHIGSKELSLQAPIAVPVADIGESAVLLARDQPLVAAGCGAAALALVGGIGVHFGRRRRKSADGSKKVIDDPSPDQPMAVLSNTANGATYPIQSRIVRLGRGIEANVRLQDETVSRSHAILRQLKSGEFEIENCSGNGTLVNDQMVDVATLADGDLITVGQTTLRYSQRAPLGETEDAASSKIKDLPTEG